MAARDKYHSELRQVPEKDGWIITHDPYVLEMSETSYDDIKDGKIWLQENRTDILIAKELVELGVPPTDIVLGLQAPEDRAYTGYAAA